MVSAPPNAGANPKEDQMSTTTNTFTVTGMTCGGCVRRVRDAVNDLDGVVDVDVELASGTVTVTSDRPVYPSAVEAAVTDAGYEVTP